MCKDAHTVRKPLNNKMTTKPMQTRTGSCVGVRQSHNAVTRANISKASIQPKNRCALPGLASMSRVYTIMISMTHQHFA